MFSKEDNRITGQYEEFSVRVFSEQFEEEKLFILFTIPTNAWKAFIHTSVSNLEKQ